MKCKSPVCFVHHPKFIEELDRFINNHCSGTTTTDETIGNIERLLIKHLVDKNPQFTSKHLGIAQGFRGFTVFWLHLVIPNSGVSRTQLPKAYFYKNDAHVSFLCLDSHLENYKDASLRKTAQNRIGEIIEVLKTHSQ